MPSRRERLKNDQRVLAALFLLPTLLVLVSVVVYPFADAVWISFQAKQAGTSIALTMSTRGAPGCVGKMPTGLPD